MKKAGKISSNIRNITLSAPADLIEQARKRAIENKQTLNTAFREWLSRFAGIETSAEQYELLMKSLKHVQSTKRFSREELNER